MLPQRTPLNSTLQQNARFNVTLLIHNRLPSCRLASNQPNYLQINSTASMTTTRQSDYLNRPILISPPRLPLTLPRSRIAKLTSLRVLLGSAFLVALLLSGCCSVKPGTLEYAIAAAKREVAKRYGWDRTEVATVRAGEGRWEITLTKDLKAFGGDATVEVTDVGKVVRVTPGM